MKGLGCILALACTIACAAAQPAKARWWLVRVEGDLETARQGEELGAALAEAASKEARLVVLELTGRRARPDVLRDCIRAVRGSEAAVAVFLDGGSQRAAGAAQAALGLAASSSWMGESAAVVWVDDGPLRELAYPRPRWELIESDLCRLLDPELGRGVACPVLRSMLWPEGASWLVGDVRAGRIEITAPGSESAAVRLAAADGSVRISAGEAVRIGLVSGLAPSAARAAAEEGGQAAPAATRTIASGLGAARRDAEAILEETDQSLDAIRKLLELPDPARGSVAKDQYRKAGREAGARLDAVEGRLAELEGLFERWPELLAMAAPGQTRVGARATSHAAKWRSAVQSRRDRHVKLKATAAKFRDL